MLSPAGRSEECRVCRLAKLKMTEERWEKKKQKNIGKNSHKVEQQRLMG